MSPLVPLQFGLTLGRQPMDAIKALRTVDRKAKEGGHGLFIASFDIDKAFDQHGGPECLGNCSGTEMRHSIGGKGGKQGAPPPTPHYFEFYHKRLHTPTRPRKGKHSCNRMVPAAGTVANIILCGQHLCDRRLVRKVAGALPCLVAGSSRVWTFRSVKTPSDSSLRSAAAETSCCNTADISCQGVFSVLLLQ